MKHTIRLAAHDDLHSVKEVVRAAYSHYVPLIGRKPAPMLDDYETLIRDRRVQVALRDEVIQAVLVLIPEDDAMLLDNVAVTPAAQGFGLGRKMLDFAERAARDLGYASIRLYANEAMTENLLLYSRIGYSETHRVEEKGLRRVYMTKSLV
jgi:GNAT superfamily N-acetyltransferase